MGGPGVSYSVSQITGLAGVSVRTMHHYDQIGLLSHGARSEAGYRRYGDAELRRLQQIMFYPRARLRPLRHNRSDQRPGRRAGRAPAPPARAAPGPAGADAAAGRGSGESDGGRETGDLADTRGATRGVRRSRSGSIRREATSRWGNTEAYRQTRQRTKAYAEKDWLAIGAEAAQLTAAFAVSYDSAAPGLAAYVRDAIAANAGRQE